MLRSARCWSDVGKMRCEEREAIRRVGSGLKIGKVDHQADDRYS